MSIAILIGCLLIGAVAGCGGDDAGEETSLVQCEPSKKKLDPDSLIGMSLDEAKAKASRTGCSVREVMRDGTSLIVTSDLVSDRIDVATEMGTVTEIVDEERGKR